jgi:large subunit ribosomal protein L7/L12
MVMASETASIVEEEKTEFNLILDEVSAEKKIAVLKVVRALTGLGLKEAKDLVEAAPKQVQENINKEATAAGKKQIEDAGGKASII